MGSNKKKKLSRLHASSPIPTDIAAPSSKRYISWVWKFFHLSETEKDSAFCMVQGCRRRRVHRADGNTTNLDYHLQHEHHIAEAKPISKQSSSLRVLLKKETHIRCSKREEKRNNQAVALMFIDNYLPFNVIDSDSLVHAFDISTNHLYIPMGRSALVEVVDGIYSDMVDMVIHK
jgi:BED zinc finger